MLSGFELYPRWVPLNLFSPQNLRKFCFNFSRVECWLQEKLKTKLLQKFVEKKNCIMGKLKVELTDLQLELGLPGVSGGQVV